MKHLTAAALSLSMAAASAAHAQEPPPALQPKRFKQSRRRSRPIRPMTFTATCGRGRICPRRTGHRHRGMLIARNQAADMPAEFSRALENGVTPAELSEIITHLAFYAG